MIENKHDKLIEALERGHHADIEAIDGEAVDMVAHGYFHQIVGRNVFRILDNYVSQRNTGGVFYYGLMFIMQSFPDNTWFVPDISYVKNPAISRPINWQYEYPHLGVPDLAVEVLASDDKADYVRRKVWTWLEKGTCEV
jgi:Uma2 family endonuclease